MDCREEQARPPGRPWLGGYNDGPRRDVGRRGDESVIAVPGQGGRSQSVSEGEKRYIYSTLQASIANCCINLLY